MLQVNTSTILESSLTLIPHNSRLVFFWIILIISVVTMIANVLAIRSTIARKQKTLQKVCIISLALSDIFSVTMFATNNLDTLSRELKIWKLGEFLCQFIPMGQVLGTTSSSLALLVIALDRYQNVTIAIVSQRWNPSIWKCIAVATLLLLICTITSYPMFTFFTNNPIRILYPEDPEMVFEDAFLCAAIQKDKVKLYYIIMAVLIFLPIITTFVWFYYQIAAMIWHHSKPFRRTKTSVSTTQVRRTRTVQVQRKIRTFKAIIVLMLVFTLCRLPYWLFFVIKLLETGKGATMWYLQFIFVTINMSNCALNPFLYTFLHQTIHACRKCHDFAYKVVLCCCCFNSKDFEDIRRNSPFVIKCEQSKVEKERNCNHSKITFSDVAGLPFKEQLI